MSALCVLLRRWVALLSLGCALGIGLTGCGGGAGSSGDAAGASSAIEAKQLAEYMQQWYFWADAIPGFEAASFTTPAQALAALRVAQDRYSFIEPASSFNAFFGAGQTIGFGIGYSVVTTNGASELVVRYTQPSSNAAAGGVRRGDRILAIDGDTITQLVSENRLDAAFGPLQAGVRRVFRLQRGPSALDLALEKSVYPVSSSFGSAVFAPPVSMSPRRVAYLHLFTFTSLAETDWQAALASLQAQGFDDLIVDLRDNGGGRVSSANLVGSTLAADQIGQPSVRLQFNSQQAGANTSYQFLATSPQLTPARLVWLTSERTCSAAEQLMHMLEPARLGLPTARIGATTCGKPVGFTPPAIGSNIYNIVTFQSANRSELANYFTGLTPTCPVSDPLSFTYGEANDPLIATALQWLATGACPVTAAHAQTKSSLLPPDNLQGHRPPGAGTPGPQRFTDTLDLR
jgi:carboxyl-terminal processing protease